MTFCSSGQIFLKFKHNYLWHRIKVGIDLEDDSSHTLSKQEAIQFLSSDDFWWTIIIFSKNGAGFLYLSNNLLVYKNANQVSDTGSSEPLVHNLVL